MLFASYVRSAAQEETDEDGNLLPEHQQLVVFPGMELTLGVPCQALLLFDANFPDDLFSLALNALAIAPSADDEAKTAETERLNNISSLRQLKEKLDEHAYLRDHYIVFPNVTNEGQHSIFRIGLAGKYAEMPCVGGYVDGDIDKLHDGIKNRIAGKDKAWGNKRIACFQTSDNRQEDHAALGKFSTWIKWATPTAEALRQACLAQESRVSQERPRLPAVAVGSISVSNSSFLGPIDLELNPQYNALIGGRGTGKSTILEYLRWALCDQPPGLTDDDTPNYQARRARLIEQTLKPVNGTVQVRFEVNGVPLVVRRSSQDGSLLIKISDDELRPCTEEEVRTLLPIQAYSQKQLSDVSVRIDELGRFITAPIRSELARIDRQLADRAARIRQTYATRQRHRALARSAQRRELEHNSLSQQAATIRESLTDLSEADRKALDDGKTFETADRAVQSWQNGVSSFHQGAVTLRASVDFHLADLEPAPAVPEAELLRTAREEYRALLEDAKTRLDALIERATSMTAPTEVMAESPWRRWAEWIAAVRTAYEAAIQKTSAHSERLSQLRGIEEQISSHARETARVREEMHALATAEANYESERGAWHNLLHERDDLLDAQCAGLTKASAGAIRAKVRRYADAGVFVESLRQALAGSRVQGAKIEGLGESITAADDPAARWEELLLDLEKLANFDQAEEGVEKRPETATLSAAGLTPGELDRMAHGLKSDDWLALSLNPIKSVPVFDYLAREGDYIPFRNASAGQQATALLKTLLNQAGPPLIIDQPEVDLDNLVMLEIVEQIWEAKRRRQLIMASHNANLVVNGDAELVAWCDYRTAGDQSRGTIVGEGAIDIQDVREAIKRIMEGGEAAFNLRREKYGF
ncbi:MAG TPA: AAA family ATPase [Actinomycetota bacterium]|nr:AAA family ATPase [Actinomycetota bacterium]